MAQSRPTKLRVLPGWIGMGVKVAQLKFQRRSHRKEGRVGPSNPFYIQRRSNRKEVKRVSGPSNPGYPGHLRHLRQFNPVSHLLIGRVKLKES
jgi:hypothetical protein